MSTNTSIRYGHTSLTARDWRALKKFYCEVFGCVPVGVERDRKGPIVDALTGVKDSHVQGQHLRLPGGGENGPTLELFQFNKGEPAQPPTVMRPGFTHLAFIVPDVEAKRKEVHAWGGRDFSPLVTLEIPGEGTLLAIYVCDPEGNILELQEWR